MTFIKYSWICLLMFYLGQLQGATITSRSTGGNWATATSWIGGTIPTYGDDVIINSSITVTSWGTTCKSTTINTTGTLTINALFTVSENITNNGTINGNTWNSRINCGGTISNNGEWTTHEIYINGTVTNNGTIAGTTDQSKIECKGTINNNGEWTIKNTYINGTGPEQTISARNGVQFNTILYIQNNLRSLSNITIEGKIIFNNTYWWNVNLYVLQLLNSTQILDYGSNPGGALKNAVLSGSGNFHNLDLYSVKNTGIISFYNVNFYTFFENTSQAIFCNWNNAYGNIINSGSCSGDKLYLCGNTDQTISYSSLSIAIPFNGNYYKDGTMYSEIVNPTSADYGIYSNGNRNIIFQEYFKIWTGQIDTIWNKTGNWSSNSIPVTTSNVIIPNKNNNPVILSGSVAYASNILLKQAATLSISGILEINNSGSKIGYDLNVEPGATVTIMQGGKLETTTNGIINDAGISGLIIKSTEAGTGSLIHQTNNVPATVKRYIDGSAEDWHFMSSPIIAQDIANSWTPSGTYGDGTGYDLYVWDEPSACWVYKLNTSVSPSWPEVHPQNYFIPGRGYLYAIQDSASTKQFIGNLVNGVISQTVTTSDTSSYKGFNLLGNPYPSSIDWKNDAGFVRNMLYCDEGGYNIWVWSSSANNYGVYNSINSNNTGTNNVSRYIAPMQGFFIRASSNGTFSFNNSARTHNGADNWLKSNNIYSIYNCISLIVQSKDELGSDEVMFDFGHTSNKNGALKLFSPVKTAPNLYLPSNTENYTIRHLTNTSETQSAPLGFKAGTNGSYSLKCIYDETVTGTIYLKDRLACIVHDFSNYNSYSFTANKSDNATRFVLYFGIRPPTNTITEAKVYVDGGGYLIVDLENITGDFSMRLSTISGRTIFQQPLKEMQKIRFPLKKRGIYIVSLLSGTTKKGYKVIY